MERWKGKVAVVTGANHGMGLAISQKLLENGINVVGLDVNTKNLQEIIDLKGKPMNGQGDLHVLQVDVRDEEAIKHAFQWVDNNLTGVDILVNNAGVGGTSSLLGGGQEEWRRILDVNVIAPVLCTKEAVASMNKRSIPEGHIININSTLSHTVPTYDPLHFYSASKHASKAITEGLRFELRKLEVPIRITGISPGLVKTGIFKACLGEGFHNKVFSDNRYINPEDVANTVEFILSSPSQVMVSELLVRPTGGEN